MAASAAAPTTDRLNAYLDELSRLSVDDLSMVALAEPDPDERAALLQKAVDAADRAGRREALAAAPGRARERLFRAYAFRAYEPTWFGLNWGRSLGRADDRARLITAVEDAAVAAVVADLLSEDEIAALREPYEIARSMKGAAPAANPIIRGPLPQRGLVAAILGLGIIGAVATTGALLVGGAMAVVAWLTRSRRTR
ncbi:MAG TPA: hypothetical protein VFV72_15480 [Candidatus Limnocylindrales bacterium]|nr:hypothetical protein [Candidatus Limnocylindrales bacterium]